MVDYVFHLAITPWNSHWKYILHIDSKSVHSPVKCRRFLSPCPIASQHQHQSWKMAKSGRFSSEVLIALNVARTSLWATVYTLGHSFLYPMVLAACRCDPPLSTNRPRIRAVLPRFSTPSVFPALMLNEWRTLVQVITCRRRPVYRRRS